MKSCNEMAAVVMQRIEEHQTVYRPRRIKKMILLAATLILLMALFTVTGVAMVKHRSPFFKGIRIFDDGVVDQTAPQTVVWKNGNGEKETLYYVYSMETANGNKIHHYTDSDSSEYVITAEGTVLSKMPSDSNYEVLYDQDLPSSSRKLTDEQIEEMASPYVIAFAGEKQYQKYDKIIISRGEDHKSFQASFIELYNGLIEIRRCDVTFDLETEEVILFREAVEYQNFDFGQLDGITREEIDQYVLKRMKRCYGPNPIPDYEIESYTLFLNENDKYYLDINVIFEQECAHLDPKKVEVGQDWYSFLYLVGDPMPMDKDAAVELAKGYFADTYGAQGLERFNRIDFRYNTQYHVSFYQTYRDLFVLDTCFVDIEKTGALDSISYRKPGALDEMDLRLLDDINHSDIVAFATAVAEKKFGDRLGSVDCDGDIYVGMEEDKYVLAFTAGCGIKTDDGVEYAQALSLRYELGGVPMSDPAAIQNAIVSE